MRKAPVRFCFFSALACIGGALLLLLVHQLLEGAGRALLLLAAALALAGGALAVCSAALLLSRRGRGEGTEAQRFLWPDTLILGAVSLPLGIVLLVSGIRS